MKFSDIETRDGFKISNMYITGLLQGTDDEGEDYYSIRVGDPGPNGEDGEWKFLPSKGFLGFLDAMKYVGGESEDSDFWRRFNERHGAYQATAIQIAMLSVFAGIGLHRFFGHTAYFYWWAYPALMMVPFLSVLFFNRIKQKIIEDIQERGDY
jgi:hypothetical protein